MPKDALQASMQSRPGEPSASERLSPRKSEVAWQSPRSSHDEAAFVHRRSLRADDSWCAPSIDQSWRQTSWQGYAEVSQARASVQNRYPVKQQTPPSRHQSDGRLEHLPTTLPPTAKQRLSRRHWLLEPSKTEADNKDRPASPRKWSSAPEGVVKTRLQQQEQRHRRRSDCSEPQRFDLTVHDTDDDEADFFPGGIKSGRARKGDMKDGDKVATMSVVSGTLAAPRGKCRRRSGEECSAGADNKHRFSTVEGDHAPARPFTEVVAGAEGRASVTRAAHGSETDKDWQTVAKNMREKFEARRLYEKAVAEYRLKSWRENEGQRHLPQR